MGTIRTGLLGLVRGAPTSATRGRPCFRSASESFFFHSRPTLERLILCGVFTFFVYASVGAVDLHPKRLVAFSDGGPKKARQLPLRSFPCSIFPPIFLFLVFHLLLLYFSPSSLSLLPSPHTPDSHIILAQHVSKQHCRLCRRPFRSRGSFSWGGGGGVWVAQCSAKTAEHNLCRDAALQTRLGERQYANRLSCLK